MSDEITQILIFKDLCNLMQTMKQNVAVSCDLLFLHIHKKEVHIQLLKKHESLSVTIDLDITTPLLNKFSEININTNDLGWLTKF